MSDESIQKVYANAVAAIGSPYDVTLDFGQKVGEADPDFAVRIAMSWEHALSLMKLLQRLIEDFEGKAGTVPDVQRAGLSETEVVPMKGASE